MQPTALIVDGDADTRGMYGEYLKYAHWQSDEAPDGREALMKALARHHDVIVTESRLRFIDGYRLCHLLKQDRLTSMTPVVFVTGDVFAPDVERAHQAGASIVLFKPCLPDALVLALNRQLASRPVLPASQDGRPVRFATAANPPRRCPSCSRTLSAIGLVDARAGELFDGYVCREGCGTFWYRRHLAHSNALLTEQDDATRRLT